MMYYYSCLQCMYFIFLSSHNIGEKLHKSQNLSVPLNTIGCLRNCKYSLKLSCVIKSFNLFETKLKFIISSLYSFVAINT